MNPRFSKPNATQIQLHDITVHDRMVIQCNVTNKHGYDWSEVYLNVKGRIRCKIPKYCNVQTPLIFNINLVRIKQAKTKETKHYKGVRSEVIQRRWFQFESGFILFIVAKKLTFLFYFIKKYMKFSDSNDFN